MKNMLDYIEEYGNYSFKEKPFNEIDNLIFSQLAYTDFKNIADKQSVSLLKGAKLFFAMYTQQEIDELIAISAKSADLLRRCSMVKRFQNIILCDYINNVSDDIDKQFSAIHFLLDDGCDVVAFRGTDVTVTGVKESAMLSYMFPVPAQIEALYYFQETCMRHSGDIILCGHSKGGNLAVFAQIFLPERGQCLLGRDLTEALCGLFGQLVDHCLHGFSLLYSLCSWSGIQQKSSVPCPTAQAKGTKL